MGIPTAGHVSSAADEGPLLVEGGGGTICLRISTAQKLGVAEEDTERAKVRLRCANGGIMNTKGRTHFFCAPRRLCAISFAGWN